MEKYYIIPNTKVMGEVEAKNAEDAMAAFAAGMDTDMNAYFKAVTEEEYLHIQHKEDVAAHERHIMDFMTDTLMKDFDVKTLSVAEALAHLACDKYCEGNGETEYECIQWAYDEHYDDYDDDLEDDKEK